MATKQLTLPYIADNPDLTSGKRASKIGALAPPHVVSVPPQPCLRAVPARKWRHKGWQRDARTIAVFCLCKSCQEFAHGPTFNYTRT